MARNSVAVLGLLLGLAVRHAQAQDVCTDAIPVLSDGTVNFASTLDASPDDPNVDQCGHNSTLNPLGPGIWFTFSGTGGPLLATTCVPETIFNHKFYLYSLSAAAEGASCLDGDGLQCLHESVQDVACPFAAQRLAWESTAGSKYYILLVATDSTTDGGNMGLSVRALDVPSNNDCAGATPWMDFGSFMDGSTVNATMDVVSTSSVCRLDVESPGVWYTVVGTGHVLRATTCHAETNFDTALSVWEAPNCDELGKCIGSNQDDFDCEFVDGSTVAWSSQNGMQYYLLVHGNSPHDVGDFRLEIEEVDMETNDACENATGPLSLNQLVTGSTVDATADDNVEGSCVRSVEAPGVWYTVSGTGGRLKASTCESDTKFDTALAVFSGDSCETMRCVVGGDDDLQCDNEQSSTVYWNTTAGQVYYLWVHGALEGSAGTFGLTVSEVSTTNASSGANSARWKQLAQFVFIWMILVISLI